MAVVNIEGMVVCTDEELLEFDKLVADVDFELREFREELVEEILIEREALIADQAARWDRFLKYCQTGK